MGWEMNNLPGLPGQDLLPTSSLASGLPDFDPTGGLANVAGFQPPAIPSGLTTFPQLPASTYRRRSRLIRQVLKRWNLSSAPRFQRPRSTLQRFLGQLTPWPVTNPYQSTYNMYRFTCWLISDVHICNVQKCIACFKVKLGLLSSISLLSKIVEGKTDLTVNHT